MAHGWVPGAEQVHWMAAEGKLNPVRDVDPRPGLHPFRYGRNSGRRNGIAVLQRLTLRYLPLVSFH